MNVKIEIETTTSSLFLEDESPEKMYINTKYEVTFKVSLPPYTIMLQRFFALHTIE